MAENGRAAIALARERTPIQWLRRTVESLAEGDNPEEFLEHTKLELFQDQVFCFTPKGRLIALPRGATPIDFAYAVHTDVGNTAVGAKINGRIMPLAHPPEQRRRGRDHPLRACQVPPAAWESLVVTGKARSAIRRATRVAVRRQYAGLGRQILERAFMRAERPFSDEKLKAALKRLARTAVDDVLAAVGRGEMFSGDVVRAVYPDLEPEKRATGESKATPPGKGWFELRQGENLKFKLPNETPGSDAIPIRGLGGDLPVRFAPGGGAVPGDRIVGILTPGEEVTIYPIQSPSLAAFDNEPERWLDVRWDLDDKRPQRFPARIALNSINEPGSLAQITTTIAEHDGNIDAVSMVRPTPDFTDLTIDLTVWDLKHLSAIISELREKRVISRVERVVA
jgi:guanosine-3',5'-bis(diphosphate) 3'-pyrophosphohydrolase